MDECIFLIIGGTSLTIYLAAHLIEEYVRFKKVVLINKGVTPIDNECEIVFRESISKVFSKIEF